MDIKESRLDRIREIFRARMGGWGPVRILAERCIADGLYSGEELESAATRAVMHDCRRALKGEVNGLPYALPSRDGHDDDGGGPAWGQLELLPHDDIAHYIETESLSVKADAVKIIRVRDYLITRDGYAPDLPPSLEILAHA